VAERKESGRRSPFIFIVAAIAILSAARAQAQEPPGPASLNETNPAEVRIVSREFRFSPAMVWVAAGRAVTLVRQQRG